MYSNEDLNLAIAEGIFSKESVDRFREKIAASKKTYRVDEEDIKFVSGFNDIFVVIACALVLFSSLWLIRMIHVDAGNLAFPLLSWLLAEYFVLKRKMALPALLLLLSFVYGIFYFVEHLYTETNDTSWAGTVAAAAASIAAYAHWCRFKVPITVAAGSAGLVVLCVTLLGTILPDVKALALPLLFLCGLVVFAFAMVWDASDTLRTTKRSDVAFWLHLLSAPLIIHPVFAVLGIFAGDPSLGSMLVVIIMYILMSALSIIVDRRALMVSSLAYVVYAISTILKELGGLSYNWAIAGIVIGAALLILSAYWHVVRVKLVVRLPLALQRYVPGVVA